MSRVIWVVLIMFLGVAGCDWPMGVTRSLEPTPDCGDDFVTQDEECDDGNAVTESCAYEETSCTVCDSNCELVAGSLLFCGDGILQSDEEEECDGGDSNTDSGGCLTSCLFAECGDGFLREDAAQGAPGYEECDDANESNEDACIAGCLLATCGDGYVQRDVEFCDDGIESADCNEDCTLAVCGDGKVNTTSGEDCDDANTLTEACEDPGVPCMVCGQDCVMVEGARCGDGIVDTFYGESCDDGNVVDDLNGCSNDCQINSVCGDGVIQEQAEVCDDGYADDCGSCNADCSATGVGAVCGDGIACEEVEECDVGDGNVDTGACLSTCVSATCGDGFVLEGVEFCDDGVESAACNADCTLAVCGDGKVNATAGEGCDDANTLTETCDDPEVSCMVCGQNCVLVEGARCGDGVVDVFYGEACDDGNVIDDLNGCSDDCQINSVCGDGVIQELTEVCDDGYADGCGSCNTDCSGEGSPSFCGDGIVCEEDEECDAGDSNGNTAACLSTCVTATCGDGYIRQDLEIGDLGYETCDDGDSIDNGNGCSENCVNNSSCGDGIVQDLVEFCDDGYSDACGDCNEDCSGLGGSFVCGDGDLCPQFEGCDDGNTRTEVCEYGGLTSCIVCDAVCVESNGVREFCGDGTVQPLYETCDLGEANTENCQDGVVDCVVCSNQCINEPGVPSGEVSDGGSCEGQVLVTYYRDLDSDGFGDINTTLDLCYQPPGYVLDNTDCDDTATMVYPDAPEQCNQVDDSCNDLIDEGILGTGPLCPAQSCKAVLDDHLPFGSGEYWLGDIILNSLRFCDFGTVGDGWDWKQPMTVTNTTETPWSNQQVKVVVDTETLINNGLMKSSGEDIRFFTDTGILLEFWMGQTTDAGTEIWILIPDLPASTQLNVMMAYGNIQADSKSATTYYDDFRVNSFSSYNIIGDTAWSPGRTFEWLTDSGRLRAASFIDYFLMIRPELIGLTDTVYIEVKGFWADGEVDGLGPAFGSSSGEYYVTQVTDDYDGAQFSTGFDGVVRYDTVPTDHQQGTFLGLQQDLVATSPGLRVGMLVSSTMIQTYIDGILLGEVSLEQSTSVSWVGLGAISNIGCEYDYLWVGPSVPSFHPAPAEDAPEASVAPQEVF